MELAIDLATPDATETECTVRDRNGLAVMTSMEEGQAHLFLMGRGAAASAWFDDADAAEALGNSMLLCAAQMREQA